MKKYVAEILSFLMICVMLIGTFAFSAPECSAETVAVDITDSVNIDYDGKNIKISSDKMFYGIYIEWTKVPGSWNLFDGKKEVLFGQKGFLHEFAEIKGGTNIAEIRREKEISIKKIHVFTDGKLPEWVQVWDEPCEKADLMLCTTHADDEQLFFLGVLPYYAGELGLNVQVVYFVNHNDSDSRPHELLNGLWTVGVRNYPVIGDAPDAWSESLGEGLANFADSGFSEDELIGFQVEMLRRFKPLIVVGHDEKGEYSHGQHIVNTHTLKKALEISNDAAQYKESADKYGVWDVPKTYLHLYGENQINIDWDVPLEKFGGKTAYEVSLEGFKCHESQHWTWFAKWIGLKSDWGVTKAADIKDYSPCKYGLYRSTVGEDSEKKNFIENIVFYKDRVEETPEEPAETDSDPVETPVETNGPTATILPEDSSVNIDNTNDNSYLLWLIAAVVVLVIAVVMIAFIIVRNSRL